MGDGSELTGHSTEQGKIRQVEGQGEEGGQEEGSDREEEEELFRGC